MAGEKRLIDANALMEEIEFEYDLPGWLLPQGGKERRKSVILFAYFAKFLQKTGVKNENTQI